MTANTMARTAVPALSVRDLRKTYDNRVEALKGVSLDVAPGDFCAHCDALLAHPRGHILHVGGRVFLFDRQDLRRGAR